MKRLSALISLTVGRAWAMPGLMMIRLIGTVLAVTLTCGVSLYSSAMGDAMLRSNLGRDMQSQSVAVSVTSQSLRPATYSSLDGYFRGKLSGDLGLPVTALHVHHNTATMPFYRADRSLQAQQRALATMSADYYEGLAGQVIVIEGSLTAGRAPGGVPVALSLFTARSLRVGVGSRLDVSVDGKTSAGPALVVTAVFAPKESRGEFWDVTAGMDSYRSVVVPRLKDFLRLQSLDPSLMPSFLWRYAINTHAVTLANAPPLIDALARIGSKVAAISDGATLIQSLSLDLSGFLNSYALLPFVLYILVAPIAAVVLYAVAVTTGLVVERQANEIVLMRSRGAGSAQIGLLYMLEGLGVGVAGTVIGPLLGLPLARVIGHASGFLSFSGGLPFAVTLEPQTYLIAAVTAVTAFIIAILPALAAARRQMTAFRQEQARVTKRPLWQRLFLDVIVLALALYGYWILRHQGSITADSSGSALADDPLIGLAPLAFAVAIALLLTRLLPWLAAFALVFGSRSSVSLSVALRSVARSPRQSMGLVQLLVLTLTLGVFAATIGGVVGANASDQVMYGAGSTLRLQEFNRDINAFQAYPLGWHRQQPGVQAASMALRLESTTSAANTTSDGATTVNLLGIDPATLGAVIWFRPDFATEPLSRLLGHVANPSGRNAIVSDTFLSATGLRLGDSFAIVTSSGRTIQGRVAGHAAYFPTLDPTQTPFAIFNVTYLNAAVHGHEPGEAWIKTRSDPAYVETMLSQFRAALPREIFAFEGVSAPFNAADDPLRAGIYGVVSVGFLIALLLALLGFLTYASLSLQRRLPEFAIVRALGLSPGQLRGLLLCEHLFMLGAGMIGGLISGVLTSRLFLPYLPIASSIMPPFLIAIPWLAVEEFLAAVLIVFMLALGVYAWMLMRLQVSRALRLGEG